MAKQGTHEIWARVAWAAFDLGRRGGIPAGEILRGLRFDEVELRRRKRIAWDDYLVMVERIAELVGGPESFEELVASQYHRGVPELARLARAIVSPKLLARFIIEVMDPMLFPPIEFGFTDLGGHRMRLGMYLKPGARPSRVFFDANTGAMRGIPCNLGLPEAEILARDTSPTHGVWEVRLPEARTIASRARSFVLHMVLGTEPDGTAFSATLGNADPDSLEVRLDEAERGWGLTTRQREVLALVVTGRSNKDIARRLACAENTVELHLTQLFRRSGLTSRAQVIAAFWSTPWHVAH